MATAALGLEVLRATYRKIEGNIATLVTPSGWKIEALLRGSLKAGDAASGFVRPESAVLARTVTELPPSLRPHHGQVESVLFDGANSAVLLRETQSQQEFRVALPQTGQFSDLRSGESVHFAFDPDRAVCFAESTPA